jgi:TRAP-type C4-dicarboxylate transport system permease small subunit
MKLLLERYFWLLKVTMTLLMAFMLVPVSIQIVSRFTGLIPRYIWTEEVARFCFVWIIMIGAMVAVRDGTHFDVDLMPHPKSKREEGVSKLIVHMAMSLMAVVFAWYGFEFAKFGAIQTSEMSGINMLSIYISFPLAGVTWVLFLAEKIVEDIQLIVGQPPETQT